MDEIKSEIQAAKNNVEDEKEEEEKAPNDAPVEKKKKKKSKKSKSTTKTTESGETVEYPESLMKKKGGGGDKGIKKMPLVFLVMMTGTTLIPVLLYMSDWIGAYVQKNNVMGGLGYRFGIGPSPKKRIVSFYEKHDPLKISNIDSIMAKHYGEYNKLTKKLERKYHDYGYFLDWEKDEAPLQLAKAQVYETMDEIGILFHKHAPVPIKNAYRNAKFNISLLYKSGRKIWRKQIWPILEPYFGVPDERTAREQKRKDAASARRKKGGKNREYRED